MGRPLHGCPEGTNDNSPAFQRWVSEPEGNESRQGRQKVFRSWHGFFRPYTRIFHTPLENSTECRVGAPGLQWPRSSACRPGAPTRHPTCEICRLQGSDAFVGRCPSDESLGWAIIGRPFGTRGRAGGFPTLKRRAILKMSLRDKERGERFFRRASNPIHCRCFQGHFAVTVTSQEDVGHTQPKARARASAHCR